MNTLLFMHWNIYYNDKREFKITDVQKYHLYLIEHYKYYFDNAHIVIHTNDIHDILALHNTKVAFDKIFKYKVTFEIVNTKLSKITYQDTFVLSFLPKINMQPNQYDVVFYANDIWCNEEMTDDLKYCLASTYFYNYERLHNDYRKMENDENLVISGGLLVINTDAEHLKDDVLDRWWFDNEFYCVNIKNYHKYFKRNGLEPLTTSLSYKYHFCSFLNIDNVLSAEELQYVDKQRIGIKVHDIGKYLSIYKMILKSKITSGYIFDTFKFNKLLNNEL